MIQWDLFQELKVGSTYENQSMLHTIDRKTNHVIISLDPEGAYDKIQHPLMVACSTEKKT